MPVYTRLLARVHPLQYLFVELTRRCNLRCSYCGSSCSADEAIAGELPTQRWVDLLREVAADTDPRQVMLAFTGGEPLLKPGVDGLFEEARRLGYAFGMVSNGGHLDETMARVLVRTSMGSIALSLDGPPGVNDALRGAGSAASVQRAIGALRAAGYSRKLEVISTLTTPSIPALEETRRFVAALRVPTWRVVPVMPIGRAAGQPELVPDDEELREVLHWIVRARRDGKRPAPEWGDEGYLGCRFETRVRPYRFHCRAGITAAGVMADGRIGACPELSDTFTQGHVERDRFMDVWARRYQVFRDRSWARRGLCADCEHWSQCRGGSLHLYTAPGEPIGRCPIRAWPAVS